MDAVELPVWHAGEITMQTRAGVALRMAEIGPRVLRPYLPAQHRDFYRRLPFVVLGVADAMGLPIASILMGRPGFVFSPDPMTLRIDALPDPADPLDTALRPGAKFGLLGIELPTRRRNRANGIVTTRDGTGLTLAVEQSFGNCPQYITPRAPAGDPLPVRIEALVVLDAAADELLARADTLFVASAAPAGVDVSHRGGAPGFLARDADGAILLPDYRGNNFFNTLGNLALNPRIGLAVPDFSSGDLLRIQGHAEILLDDRHAVPPHTGRVVRITPTHAAWVRGGAPKTNT